MSTNIDTLLSRRASVWEQQKQILDRAASERRQFTAEERQAMDRQDRDLNALTAEVDRVRRGAIPAGSVPVADAEIRYEEAFGRFLRGGLTGLSEDDRKALAEKRADVPQGTGTGAAGGYLIPQGYWLRITERLKAFGGLMGESNIINTATGQPLPWPSNDDTANAGSLLSEQSQVTELDLTIGTNELYAWTYSSGLVLVSLALLQDSAFDLDTWVPEKLGTRLGRAIAADLVTGSGSSRPLGIADAPTTGVTAASGSVTASAWALQDDAAAYDDLVDLAHSVDPAYRQLGNCKYLMNDLTSGAIRKVRDGAGRPLWSPQYPGGFASSDTGSGGPAGANYSGPADTILGYPVVIDNAMPTFGASTTPILFGDFKAGYVTRNVQETIIMRLSERYADYLQVGFFGFQRIDGRPDDTNAVRALATPAS